MPGRGGTVDPSSADSQVVWTCVVEGSAAAAPATNSKKKKSVEALLPVWFSFFLTNFSENLAVRRIWLCRESEYH
jgi:hypothetical protein